MTARDLEQHIMNRCLLATTQDLLPTNQCEANVFRIAALVLQSQFPNASTKLLTASNQYFQQHPDEKVSAAESVKKGWIISLPRLRDNLSQQLRRG